MFKRSVGKVQMLSSVRRSAEKNKAKKEEEKYQRDNIILKNSSNLPKLEKEEIFKGNISDIAHEDQNSFLLEVEITNLNSYGRAGQLPLPRVQKQMFEEAILEDQSEEEVPGDSRFIISITWWNKWCNYV